MSNAVASSLDSKIEDFDRSLLMRRSSELLRSTLRLRVHWSAELRDQLADRILRELLNSLTLERRTAESLNLTGLTDAEIELAAFRTCPSWIENLLICSDLSSRYGPLDDVPGFTRTKNLVYVLNLHERHAHKGILAPEKDSFGRIRHLRVFRSANDERSFVLRSTLGGLYECA